jgi:hypothetical protein
MDCLKWIDPEPSTVQGITCYVTFKDYYMFYQIAYTTLNSWSHGCQVTCRVFGKNCKKTNAGWMHLTIKYLKV